VADRIGARASAAGLHLMVRAADDAGERGLVLAVENHADLFADELVE
jgi:hypothetical protein